MRTRVQSRVSRPLPDGRTPAAHHPHRQNERGFALLVVFLIAAGIMISLYLELPRVAFESQRNREEMLIERGEQYSRSIEVFYRKNKRYPGKIEDLENFNNLRFLRKRYKDPLTGKDEWRMIHMGPAGQLADSLVEKPGQMPGQQLAGNGLPGSTGFGTNGQPGGGNGFAGSNGFGTNGQPAVPGAPVNPEDVNVAQNRIRPSDRNPGRPGQPGFGNDPNNPNNNGQPQQQLDSNGNPVTDPNQNPGFNAANQPGQNVFNQNQQPNYNPNFPQQTPNFPGQQPAFGTPPGINPGGLMPANPTQSVYYQNGQPFSAGAQIQGQVAYQNGQNPAQAGFGQNPALNAINNQLRNQNGFQPAGFNNSGYGLNPVNAGQIPPGATRNADGSYTLLNGAKLDPNGQPINTGTQGPGVTPPPTPGGPPQIGNGNFGTKVLTNQQGGQSFGGAGIAGVASQQTGVGIKRYNDRTKYKEWEFVFDYRKPKTKPTTGVTGLKTSEMTTSSGFGK